MIVVSATTANAASAMTMTGASAMTISGASVGRTAARSSNRRRNSSSLNNSLNNSRSRIAHAFSHSRSDRSSKIDHSSKNVRVGIPSVSSRKSGRSPRRSLPSRHAKPCHPLRHRRRSRNNGPSNDSRANTVNARARINGSWRLIRITAFQSAHSAFRRTTVAFGRRTHYIRVIAACDDNELRCQVRGAHRLIPLPQLFSVFPGK